MKSLKLLKNIYWSKDPFFIILFVTARCNARCTMCFNWENIDNEKSRNELTLEEIEKTSSNIKSFQQLTLSGGEPFLRDDLSEICTVFNRNSNVQFITIPTNGLLPDRINRILSKALDDNPDVHFRIGLSTSEIDEELDEIFNVKNSFQKHQETFKVLQSLRKNHSNLNIDAGIVFNKYNKNRIPEIINTIVSTMPDSNPIVSLIRGEPRISDSKDVTLEEIEEVYSYCRNNLSKVKNRSFADFMNLMRDMVHEMTLTMIQEKHAVIPCQCGKRLIVIYDNGDVFPCELLNHRLGNLRDYDYNIHTILSVDTNKKYIKNIIDSKCYCTWECALNNNLIFSFKHKFDLLYRFLKFKSGLYK